MLNRIQHDLVEVKNEESRSEKRQFLPGTYDSYDSGNTQGFPRMLASILSLITIRQLSIILTVFTGFSQLERIRSHHSYVDPLTVLPPFNNNYCFLGKMSVRTYNPSVRVGNWNEDIQLEEDKLKQFMDSRDAGELLYQRRTKLDKTIFKKIDLSISRDGYVHFGDKVSIQCPAALDRTQYFAHIAPRDECSLAVVPQINKILYSEKFEAPCKVTGSKEVTSNLRSTFVIRSKDGTRDGEPLRYGQVCYLSTMENEGGNLFLQSDRKALHTPPNKSRHQDVCLVDNPSSLSEWKVLHFKPQLRFEYEGVQVPANTKIIFNHVVTNQDLCVEEEILIRTTFNTREYEITTCTVLDSHRAEKEQNHWMFVMGMPGDVIYPVTEQSTCTESTSVLP